MMKETMSIFQQKNVQDTCCFAKKKKIGVAWEITDMSSIHHCAISWKISLKY